MVSEKDIVHVLRILLKQKHLFQKTALMDVSERYHQPFHVLISCILSLRTKDEVTGPASLRLFQLADTPQTLLKLPIATIEQAIYPVGFYKTKARTLKNICKDLLEKYNGKVPDTLEELLTLKGVGRKTAAITIVYGHKKNDAIPVDVHVHVIANRLGWVKTKHPDKTMDKLMNIIPRKYWTILNDLLVQFGQNICLTASPWCSRCPLNSSCPKIGVPRHR